jgi:L-ascorbate 6-phosphate lactonase
MPPNPIDALRELSVPPGQVGLTWLGQAGFVLRSGETTALIDPFVSPWNGRLYESSLVPSQATEIDLILCTHEHIDHFDGAAVPAIAAASPGAVIVLPAPIVDMATEAGIAADRVVGAKPGETLELAGLHITPVPAKHGVTMDDAYGFGEELSGGLVRFLGYVVDAGDVRMYHAGDTIHFDGMESMLRDFGIDVGMLPINGRDPERESRGIVGNLTERESAWLAREAGFELLIPMHYDVFERNRGYPSLLLQSVEVDHPGVPVSVPAREHPFVVTGRGSSR